MLLNASPLNGAALNGASSGGSLFRAKFAWRGGAGFRANVKYAGETANKYRYKAKFDPARVFYLTFGGEYQYKAHGAINLSASMEICASAGQYSYILAPSMQLSAGFGAPWRWLARGGLEIMSWRFAAAYSSKAHFAARASLCAGGMAAWRYVPAAAASASRHLIFGCAWRYSCSTAATGRRGMEYQAVYSYRVATSGGLLAWLNGTVAYRYVCIFDPDTKRKFHRWREGVGYRVVRLDEAPGGLEQGGIKRTEIMANIQRLGL